MKKRNYLDDDKDVPDPTWPAIRDLFDQLIRPAKGWPDAEIQATPEQMAQSFFQAYPGVTLKLEDLRLALHDLNIPYERNEHNQKFYYLANWK